ncbi:9748_t:CDS:2, partial [Cetraspora pellucida]
MSVLLTFGLRIELINPCVTNLNGWDIYQPITINIKRLDACYKRVSLFCFDLNSLFELIMASSTNKREIITETVNIFNESTPLLNNNETSNLPIINSPWYKTPSVYWLIPLFAVNAISFGLTVTIKVEFYIQAVCKNYYESKENVSSINLDIINDVDICNIPEIHAITSQLMMILSLCLAIPGIFVLVPLGEFSDRKGRRFALLIAGSGRILDAITIILIGNFMESLGLGFLIIGQLMVGFC